MVLTIILTAIAGIAVLVGLFIASNQLFIDARFMREMRKSPPFLGSKEVRNSGVLVDLLEKVWKQLDDVMDLEEFQVVFQKGYSFVITCAGEACLLVALFLAIIENCCYQRVPEKEYLLDNKKPIIL